MKVVLDILKTRTLYVRIRLKHANVGADGSYMESTGISNKDRFTPVLRGDVGVAGHPLRMLQVVVTFGNWRISECTKDEPRNRRKYEKHSVLGS